ncbi:AEC family transporter [Piscinibacter sakaiensis]|uniref:AEC family transporter n=1 Tax=Piscinibacter sakaiensis TaxID=1547922 RepID=UPI003AAA5D7A
MSLLVFIKLLAIVAVVAIGYVVGRARWLSPDSKDADPARTMSYAAFYIFVPALLFRTTARLDLNALPWGTLIAFFAPVAGAMLLVYVWQRHQNRNRKLPVAAPSVRAMEGCFGNTVQVGVPMATALFGEAGLAIHITIISLHALTLMTMQTALVELDLAREHVRTTGSGSLLRTLRSTVYNTVVHPVVLPVLAGLIWNATGVALPSVLDEALVMLGSAVVPLCLVLIGISLAYYGIGGAAKGAVIVSIVKLILLPLLVLVVAHWGLGLSGLPLSVVVIAASLPVGSNAMIFAQRYGCLQAEASAAILLSTVAFAATAPLWLLALAWLA